MIASEDKAGCSPEYSDDAQGYHQQTEKNPRHERKLAHPAHLQSYQYIVKH
ncbi:hypothetical protein [Segatella copri]|uniref:hypothetical protein n=1 Tax=Segatella copri TaxID=165179 RepID=UPI001931A4F2|nr:hypothetical protein [Segatella copri]